MFHFVHEEIYNRHFHFFVQRISQRLQILLLLGEKRQLEDLLVQIYSVSCVKVLQMRVSQLSLSFRLLTHYQRPLVTLVHRQTLRSYCADGLNESYPQRTSSHWTIDWYQSPLATSSSSTHHQNLNREVLHNAVQCRFSNTRWTPLYWLHWFSQSHCQCSWQFRWASLSAGSYFVHWLFLVDFSTPLFVYDVLMRTEQMNGSEFTKFRIMWDVVQVIRITSQLTLCCVHTLQHIKHLLWNAG